MTKNHWKYAGKLPWKPGDDAVFVVAVRDRDWFLKAVSKGLFSGRVSIVHSVGEGLRPDKRHRYRGKR